MPSIQVQDVSFHRLDMETRFPFRYGIASMTELPHMLVSATVQVGETLSKGIAADGLPPKWFTKNPETTFEHDDLPGMLDVIRHASEGARLIGTQPSFYRWWHELYQHQYRWAKQHDIPGLLAGFGVSLLERAVLSAFCQATERSVHNVIRGNLLDIDLQEQRPELAGVELNHVLAESPPESAWVRHTVGLGDPLTQGDADGSEAPEDGLPWTLEENIAAYGLEYFKIKLSGDLDTDRRRLEAIVAILQANVSGQAKFTLDGNESFRNVTDFRDVWDSLRAHDSIRHFFDTGLLFVEQPIHRSVALADSVRDELSRWVDAPPMIIDESDADLHSLPRALEVGYSGTSHKNCKGIIKGVLAAASIKSRSSADHPMILSGEDLANVGPVALLQDLAVASALGIEHIERNGHHYFSGLSMFPTPVHEVILREHGDLYESHRGYPSLRICAGQLSLRSIHRAPFGLAGDFDLSPFAAWTLN